MIAFSRQNTWKDFPVFWGERLELYSITDGKSYFVIENTKFNQTIQDPLTICGDYIYYQEESEIVQSAGLCRVNVRDGKREELGITFENYVIDDNLFYYNSYVSEDNENDTKVIVYCRNLETGETKQILSMDYNAEKSEYDYLDYMNVVDHKLILHIPQERELISYNLEDEVCEKKTFLEKNENLISMTMQDNNTMLAYTEQGGLFLYDIKSGNRIEFLQAEEIEAEGLSDIAYGQLPCQDGKIVYYDNSDKVYVYDIEKDQTTLLFDAANQMKSDWNDIDISLSANYIVIKVGYYTVHDGFAEKLYILTYDGELYGEL
jgi:hypothetical protein